MHAHAASAVRAATLAGCTTVTHGSQITDAEADLMAAHGTFFEPQTGLLLQNYLENKAHFLGVGRGVDLMLYIFLVATVYALMQLYARVRTLDWQVTQLSRALAIANVRKLEQ